MPARTSGSDPVSPDRHAAVAATIEAIDMMELEELRDLWNSHFGTPPPLRSLDLMRLTLGWRLQARAWGGIDAGMRRRLKVRAPDAPRAPDLAPGTVISRTWQGVTCEVEVRKEGFVWNGETWPSLSAVATAITGTRWNGPRFFGLRGIRS